MSNSSAAASLGAACTRYSNTIVETTSFTRFFGAPELPTKNDCLVELQGDRDTALSAMIAPSLSEYREKPE
jgi:hypothetical protein